MKTIYPLLLSSFFTVQAADISVAIAHINQERVAQVEGIKSVFAAHELDIKTRISMEWEKYERAQNACREDELRLAAATKAHDDARLVAIAEAIAPLSAELNERYESIEPEVAALREHISKMDEEYLRKRQSDTYEIDEAEIYHSYNIGRIKEIIKDLYEDAERDIVAQINLTIEKISAEFDAARPTPTIYRASFPTYRQVCEVVDRLEAELITLEEALTKAVIEIGLASDQRIAALLSKKDA